MMPSIAINDEGHPAALQRLCELEKKDYPYGFINAFARMNLDSNHIRHELCFSRRFIEDASSNF